MNEENNLNTQPVVNTDQQTPVQQPQTTEPIQTPI